MRLLIVSQYFWPETFLINTLIELLLERGIEVSVLTGKPNYPDGRLFDGYHAFNTQTELYKGAKVFRVPIVTRGKNSKLRLALNYLSFMLSASLFGRFLLKNQSYDAVFVYAPSPLLQAIPAVSFAKRRGVPLITWVQDLWPETLTSTANIQNPWIINLVACAVRYIYKSCSLILVQSNAFIGPVAKLTDKTDKIHYFPNFFKISELDTVSQQGKVLVESIRKSNSVVFTGNLGTVQSLETVVKVASLINYRKDIKIFLIGSGSLDKWLALQKESLCLDNLILAGRYEATDMPEIFNAAKALLVTLNADPTLSLTVPSKVQAYMASGKPIIAALDGEGARIISESGAGYCSKAGDEHELMQNLLKLLDLPEEYRIEMGVKAKYYYETHFSPNQLVDKLIMHIEESISRKTGSNR